MGDSFTGYDQGVLGKPFPAAATLMAMKKSELIDLLHLADHNYKSLNIAYRIALDNSKCNRCPIMQMIGEKHESKTKRSCNLHNTNLYR